MVGGHPLPHHEPPSSHAGESGSNTPLECREVRSDLNVNLARETHSARVEGNDEDSDAEFQDPSEALPPRSLVDSIAAPRFVPTTSVTNMLHYPGVCPPLKPGSFQQTRVPNSLLMEVNYVDSEPQGTEVIPVHIQTRCARLWEHRLSVIWEET